MTKGKAIMLHAARMRDCVFIGLVLLGIGAPTNGVEPVADDRSVVPAAEQVEIVRRRLRRDLGELVDLNPVSQPAEWAEFLLDQSKWQDLTSHYAALYEAAETSVSHGNIELTARAVNELCEQFAAELGKTAAELIVKHGGNEKLTTDVASQWIDEVEIWMLDQRFSDCREILRALGNHVEQGSELADKIERLAEENSVYASWLSQRSDGKLADAHKGEVDGKCLAVVESWENALPLLATARDVNLRKAALADQAASDGTTTAADACQAWLRVVATQPTLRVWQSRAEHWFDVAASGERTTAVVNLERRMKRLGIVKKSVVTASTGGTVPDLTLRQTHPAHTGIVSSVDFSLDGSTYCSAGQDAAIKVWKSGEDEPFQVLTGHEGDVFGVALSHDGRFVASGGRDKRFRVWNIQTGQATEYPETHTVSIRDVAFVGNSKWVATVSDDRKVALWMLDSQLPVVVLGHQGIVYSVAVSAKGKWVASGSEDRQVHVFRPANEPQVNVLKGHAAPVHAVAFTPDERRLVSGDATGALMVWDLNDGTSETLEAHSGIVTGISFAAEGRWFATCGKDATIHIWDASSLEKRQTIGPLADEIRDVAFSPNGRTLVVASKDGKVFVYRRGT